MFGVLPPIMPRWYALTFQMPTSSAMIMMMFGLAALAICHSRDRGEGPLEEPIEDHMNGRLPPLANSAISGGPISCHAARLAYRAKPTRDVEVALDGRYHSQYVAGNRTGR